MSTRPIQRGRLFAAIFRAALAGILAGLCACGSSDSEVRVVVPFGGGPLAPGPSAAEITTVLMVALDGVRPADIERPVGDLPALPNFDSLRASSVPVSDVFCAMTSGNGAMATLLTGLHAREHGVVSVRDLGRTRLDKRVPLLQESFQSEGWRTIASVPEARLGRGVGGFARGVDTFAAPRPGEPARTAGGVLNAVESELEEALREEGAPVFCLVSFGDVLQPTSRTWEPGEARLAAPFVRARMAPFASKKAEVASALERLEDEPVNAMGDFTKLFARSRGSAQGKAWQAAETDIRLARMDRALGRILALLESTGRASTAAVVVSGLRGRAVRGADTREGPRFQDEAIRVPLWLRLPGGPSVPLAPADTTAVAPWIAERFGLDLAESRFQTNIPRFALTTGPYGRLHALRADSARYERYSDGEIVSFDPAGRAIPAGDEAAKRTLLEFSAPPRVEFRPAPDAAGFEADWSLSHGSLVRRIGDRRPPPMRGRASLAEATELPLTERVTSIRFGLRGPGAEPSKLIVGSTPAMDLPVLYLPFENAPAVVDGDKPTVEILRSSGLQWSLKVRGTGRADVLLSVWPPRDPTDGIEVPASNARVTSVPGREDLIHLSGELPFDILLKKMGKEDFAIACRMEEGFVSPSAMAADGSWLAGPEAFDVWLPAWQPAVSEALPDVTEALYGEPAPPPSGAVAVCRRGYGPVPNASSALEFDALELLRTLPFGE